RDGPDGLGRTGRALVVGLALARALLGRGRRGLGPRGGLLGALGPVGTVSALGAVRTRGPLGGLGARLGAPQRRGALGAGVLDGVHEVALAHLGRALDAER